MTDLEVIRDAIEDLAQKLGVYFKSPADQERITDELAEIIADRLGR